MPVRNEARHIERTLDCLRNQVCREFALEFLLVDGHSEDGTREIIARHSAADSRIILVDNPRRSTPAAFNLGLAAARGDYVCILGAHAEYPADYIETCFHELIAQNVTACSGVLSTVPQNQSSGAKLAAWCLTHKFASGNSVRSYCGGLVDTVPYPVIRKQALIEAGGYDESLLRNQDNDMNQRLRALGHELYLTARTQARYYARADVPALLRYAYMTGQWNALTMTRNAASMSIRHFAPFFLVASVAILLAASTVAVLANGSMLLLTLTVGMLALHLLVGTTASLRTAYRERDLIALLLPFVALAFHFAYGSGTVSGFLRQRGRSTPRPEHTQNAGVSVS